MHGKLLGVLLMVAAVSGCVIVTDGAKDSMVVDTPFNSGNGDLARTVRDAYLVEPLLQDAEVRVSARDGVVKLRGQVADAAQAERAIAIAQRTPGVTRIESRLTVGY